MIQQESKVIGMRGLLRSAKRVSGSRLQLRTSVLLRGGNEFIEVGFTRLLQFQNSDERRRFQKVLQLLGEIDQERLAKLIEAEQRDEEAIGRILDVSDRKVVETQRARELKHYNLTEVSKILGVTRQGLYYWIRKGWVKVKRDGRSYPAFTVFDNKRIMSWRNSGADG